jgi:hypothetical protein
MFRGYIIPVYSGIYNFRMITNGPCHLLIENKTIIVKNVHGKKVVRGKIELESGKIYPLRIYHGNLIGKPELKLLWKAPDKKDYTEDLSRIFLTKT